MTHNADIFDNSSSGELTPTSNHNSSDIPHENQKFDSVIEVNEMYADSDFSNESDIKSEKSVQFIEDEESVPIDEHIELKNVQRLALCDVVSIVSK